MPRLPDAKARGPLSLRPRNPEEEKLFQEFRRICRKDGYEYMDLFKPVIERVVYADNPQLHFVKTSEALILNKNPTLASKPEVKVTCVRCGGEGCQFCGQLGFYYEEKTP